MSISNLLFASGKAFSSLGALKIGDRIISYDELHSKALRLAGLLKDIGVNNETIGLVGQRKASSYLGILAIIYAGCHYTPLNPKYNPSRIRAMLHDSRIRVLVGDVDDLLALESLIGPGELPENIVIPEGITPEGRQWKTPGAGTVLDSPVNIDEQQLAYLLYTSGSTGAPKAVQVSHANVSAFLKSMSSLYSLEPGFNASQTFDLSFDPSVSDMFFTWSKGGMLCVLPEEEMFLPGEYIKREKINFWNSVPSLAGFMSKMGQLSDNAFPELRYSMFCGEQFPKHIADAWRKAAPGSTIENLYGPTEATVYISRYLYAREDSEKSFRNSIIPIGHPFPQHEVAIVDEGGNKVYGTDMGEICFKGGQITRGYFRDTEKTKAVFVNFPWDDQGGMWYKTGDIGFYNIDGNVECIGRRDSQIKLSGRRIEIGEIEAVLAKFEMLSDAVVVPVRDDNEVVIGCVAFTTNILSKETELQIRKDSSAFLEKIFFPRKIYTIDKFPISMSGKVDRKTLAVKAKDLMVSGK